MHIWQNPFAVFNPWCARSNSMIARVAAVLSSRRDWKANVLQFAPDDFQHNKILQARHVRWEKHALILLGGEGGAVPPEYHHCWSPSSQEWRPEKDWALCLALTPWNAHHAASLASTLGNSQDFEMSTGPTTGAKKKHFNLNQWELSILVCKTRIKKDVTMTPSHKES